MSKALRSRLRRFHGQLHEKRIELERRKRQKDLLRTAGANTVFLVGTPIHPNIGDSAIVLAEIGFLRKILPKEIRLVEVTDDSLRRNRKLAYRSFLKTGALPILWHGGGNMGDVWIEQELMRRETFSALKQKRIICFPQTLFYSDTESGKRLEQDSVPYYNGKAALTLTAREPRSYEIMRSLYPDTDIRLIPDIVLSANAEDFGVQPCSRKGILLCLRSDIEKSISSEIRDGLIALLAKQGESVHITDMGASSYIITAENRAGIIQRKMQSFRGVKLAVTDRLHGMVFAALTGTPCVVFSNNNHKVKSTYTWLSHLPYIRFVETIEEAERCIPELLSFGNCEYDNAVLLPRFDELKELILEACKGFDCP